MNSILLFVVERIIEDILKPPPPPSTPTQYEDDRLLCFANSLITRTGEVVLLPNRTITVSELHRLLLRHRGLDLNPYGSTDLMREITADRLYSHGFTAYECGCILHIEPCKCLPL